MAAALKAQAEPGAARAALPPDDALRAALHDEVHARPPVRIRLPALVVHIAVLNSGVSRDEECAHLRRLSGQAGLDVAELAGNFKLLRLGGAVLKWERHTEFTRYALVQPLPHDAALHAAFHAGLSAGTGADAHDAAAPRLDALAIDNAWLRAIPGRTVAAVKLALVHGALDDPQSLLARAQRWLGSEAVAASLTGRSPGGAHHSLVVTDFALRADGFEHLLVVAPASTTEMRAGRITQRLLDLETYRLMALRALPAAKALAPELGDAEATLATLTAQLEAGQVSDQQLLEQLIALAARLERATAAHDYRFAATRAYDTLVAQRVAELREAAIPGVQMLGVFLQRRMNPAIATVAAGERRLASLSQRVERTSALLRTRVDIATEARSQQLLAKLTRGQELQLRLQTTVEGLSIAAISYYVVSLLLYGAKAAKAAGLAINPEMAAGALIPLVLWAVWRTTRRIHARLHAGAPD